MDRKNSKLQFQFLKSVLLTCNISTC
ncbi:MULTISPECIES: hypothetical protein [unclassified Bartonella]